MTTDARQTAKVRSVFGEIEVFKGDEITRQIEKFGNHTRPDFAFACAAIDPVGPLFDLGGHIGTFALGALQKLTRDTPMLVVEGVKETFDVLSRNLAAHASDHSALSVRNAFVGNADAAAYESRVGNSMVARLVPRASNDPDTTHDISAPLVSLDQLVEDHFAPSFIKIDTEGSEYDTLARSQFLGDSKPLVYMEINPESLSTWGHTSADMDALMRKLGYHYFRNTLNRNAAHDYFRVVKFGRLDRFKQLYDVLCVPNKHPLLGPLGKLVRG